VFFFSYQCIIDYQKELECVIGDKFKLMLYGEPDVCRDFFFFCLPIFFQC